VGQTVAIDTPEGAITCTGGVNREFTGKNGPEGAGNPRVEFAAVTLTRTPRSA
jgi:hypothetical protein